MATLDRIMGMQQQGIPDTEISTQLQNEGVSATEINDSLNQAKIKNAVSPPEGMPPASTVPEGMQTSIMTTAPEQEPAAQQPPTGQPAPQGIPPAQTPAPQPAAAEVYPPQATIPEAPAQPQDEYYAQTPQAYGQDYYAPQAGIDTETISEIAEQVTTEKLNEYKTKVGDIASFKNGIQDRVDDIDDRLKRIEDNIDKLQQSIIGKVGEFGESNAMIHKDLDNLHNTVSKLMNPLIDNYKELKKLTKK